MAELHGRSGHVQVAAKQLDIRYERGGVSLTIAVPYGSPGQQAA